MRYLAERLTFDKLFRMSEPKRVLRSHKVKGPPLEIDSYQDAVYYAYNFKSYPSTTGLRHRGYVKFLRPAHGGQKPLQHLDCIVDCTCPDYRYRWAWTNKQRGASRVGAQSLNQALNRAPRHTNPKSKPGLCVAENELVSTRRGFVKIQDVSPGDEVWTLEGWQRVSVSARTGVKPVVKITLRSGRNISVTPEHKIYAFEARNGFQWVEARHLTRDHHLCVALPADSAAPLKSITIPKFTSWNKTIHYPAKKVVLDETFAELTGYMVAEGSFGFFAAESSLLREDFIEKWRRVFGEKAATKRKHGCFIGAHGNRILSGLGFKFGSYQKRVPDWILKSRKSVILAFLRGCYAGDGCFSGQHSTYGTVSEALARELQLLLASVGISASLSSYRSGVNKSLTWLVRTSSGPETGKLFKLINPLRGCTVPPSSAGKPAAHNYTVNSAVGLFQRVIARTLPKCDDKTLVPVRNVSSLISYCENVSYDWISARLAEIGCLSKKRLRKGGKAHNVASLHDLHEVLREYRANKITRLLALPKFESPWRINRNKLGKAVDKLKALLPDAHAHLYPLVRDDLFFDAVESVDPSKTVSVYDLTVNNNVSHFTVNGIVVHNCKHILAARSYIYGLLSSFPNDTPDTAEKLNKLTQFATRRWINFPQQMAAARERDQLAAAARNARNIGQEVIPGAAPAPEEPEMVIGEPGREAGDEEDYVEIIPPEIRDAPELNQVPAPPQGAPAAPAAPSANKSIQNNSDGKTPDKLARVSKSAGFKTPAEYNFRRRQGLGDSLGHENEKEKMNRVFKNNGLSNMNTLTEAQRIISELERDELAELRADGEDATGGDFTPGDDQGGELPPEAGAGGPMDDGDAMGGGDPMGGGIEGDPMGGGDLPPSDPAMSDSAAGADSEGSAALGLLREIRDFLGQLSSALVPQQEPEAGEGGPAMPIEGGAEGDLEGEIDVPVDDPDEEVGAEEFEAEGDEEDDGAPEEDEEDDN